MNNTNTRNRQLNWAPFSSFLESINFLSSKSIFARKQLLRTQAAEQCFSTAGNKC